MSRYSNPIFSHLIDLFSRWSQKTAGTRHSIILSPFTFTSTCAFLTASFLTPFAQNFGPKDIWIVILILMTNSQQTASIFRSIDSLLSSPPTTATPPPILPQILPFGQPRATFSCPLCNKSFVTQLGLLKHGKSHEETHKCSHCGKQYRSMGALKMHVKTHTLPCECNLCGKSFSRPWLLKGHQRTHTGERPFTCHECGRSFADRSNLRAHQLTHKTIRKFRCLYCGAAFARSHVKTKHEIVCNKRN